VDSGGEEISDDGEAQDDGEPKKKKSRPNNRWKKKNREKVSYQIKSLSEVFKTEEAVGEEMEIIDMTGPKQHRTTTKKMDRVRTTLCPELTDNLEFLMEIQENEYKTKMVNDRESFLDQSLWTRECSRLEKELEVLTTYELETLTSYENIMHQICESQGSQAITACLELIKSSPGYEHFKKLKLEDAVLSKLVEVLTRALEAWVISRNNSSGPMAVFINIRLKMDQAWDQLNNRSKKVAHHSLFGKLLEYTFYPKLMDEIDIMQADLMTQTIDSWWEVIPEADRRVLLKGYLLPELIVAANRWSPLTDPKPVHQWLTPYFQLFQITNFTDSQREFSKVSQIVQTKLGNCLDQAGWTVTDLSAVKMLTPLQSMWTLDAWRVFTNKFIIPKLKKTLVHNPT
jgi:tuftelin-interacting protein 11